MAARRERASPLLLVHHRATGWRNEDTGAGMAGWRRRLTMAAFFAVQLHRKRGKRVRDGRLDEKAAHSSRVYFIATGQKAKEAEAAMASQTRKRLTSTEIAYGCNDTKISRAAVNGVLDSRNWSSRTLRRTRDPTSKPPEKRHQDSGGHRGGRLPPWSVSDCLVHQRGSPVCTRDGFVPDGSKLYATGYRRHREECPLCGSFWREGGLTRGSLVASGAFRPNV
ncbi:uncharacterized protein BDZ99DRAFT_470873 [Mytilinidion resinicola]|uniref:Uncharacterized protein n=1 Tax=Mytilinidion resinicola TaxID=574789 RepID=A0A6A6ZA92_9PEZI|nr:uncharacterized protein BDZ99DRAFT_470873 [Mytilinidion resinicola]KAF2817936.1 hypothetical protein BDZ99DRAFT_470873 [Mytilinidion resinicola]